MILKLSGYPLPIFLFDIKFGISWFYNSLYIQVYVYKCNYR